MLSGLRDLGVVVHLGATVSDDGAKKAGGGGTRGDRVQVRGPARSRGCLRRSAEPSAPVLCAACCAVGAQAILRSNVSCAHAAADGAASVDADVIIHCEGGGRYNTSWLVGGPAHNAVCPSGELRVDHYLRVSVGWLAWTGVVGGWCLRWLFLLMLWKRDCVVCEGEEDRHGGTHSLRALGQSRSLLLGM